MADKRYAVYYLPPSGSALATFGAGWLGWDVENGQRAAHPRCALDVASITATPRLYGFHGTLKPPFRLAQGQTEAGLHAAVGVLAASLPAFDAPPLQLARLGGFMALVPRASDTRLSALASACVRELDRFRAPAGAQELAKRRAKGLTALQETLLAEWGYPYVLDAFRFHLTLTGRLDGADLDAAEAVLGRLTRSLTTAPLPVHEIALVRQVGGEGFELLHRYALSG